MLLLLDGFEVLELLLLLFEGLEELDVLFLFELVFVVEAVLSFFDSEVFDLGLTDTLVTC